MENQSDSDHDIIVAPVNAAPHGAPRARQPWGRLLQAVLDLAGDWAELKNHTERDWASATFSGSRHAIALRFSGDDAAEAGEAFIVAFPITSFCCPAIWWRMHRSSASMTGTCRNANWW